MKKIIRRFYDRNGNFLYETELPFEPDYNEQESHETSKPAATKDYRFEDITITSNPDKGQSPESIVIIVFSQLL